MLRLILLPLTMVAAMGADVAGVVRDPSGSNVAEASVRLVGREGAFETSSGSNGEFRFAAVAAGQYKLTISAPGFAAYTRTIDTSRRLAALIVELKLKELRQEITVSDVQEGLSITGDANQDVALVTGSELASLPSLNGDYLAPLMRFIDPSSVGTGGVAVTVDGHEGPTSRVPRSMIKEVKINSNPYSAQFTNPGRGRIEVITKNPEPGYHGSITAILRDYHFNAREPFARTRPPETWQTFMSTLTGPLGRGKKNFWMLSGERNNQKTVGVVYALLPSGLFQENSPTPMQRNWATARWNHRHGKDRSLWLGYEHDDSVSRNQQTGGQRLPDAGINSGWFWNEILFSDQGLLTQSLSHSLRSWIGHVGFWTSSRTQAPGVVVSGAFTGGGGQESKFTPRTYFVFSDILTYVRGRHTITFGAELQDFSRFGASIRDNFGGTTFYSSLADYTAQRPFLYTRQTGGGHRVYATRTGAAFFQDEMQVAPGLSAAIGVRYSAQNHFNGDWNNFAPRSSLAWSPGKSRRVVIRSGAGMFYDRLQPGYIVDTEMYDRVAIGRIIYDPLNPVGANAVGITRFDKAGRIPSSVHFNAGVEFALTKAAAVTASYVGARGLQLLRSNDANAPVGLLRPDANFGQVRNIDSGGTMSRNAMEITSRGKFGKHVTGNVQYVLGSYRSDTEGLAFFPATPGQWAAEWGRANGDVRHRLALLLNGDVGKLFQIGGGATFASGMPVNITTGIDGNRDGVVNDRPAGVGRNTLRGPGLVQVDVRMSKRIAGKEKKTRAAVISVDAFNVVNRVNYATYVGVLASPFFGRPVASLPARRLQLQVEFEF